MTSFSVILATGARYMLPIILMFSAFLLVRGHYLPGGGFIGGLVAAGGIVLFALAYGVARAREVLGVDPIVLIGTGLLIGIGSGIPALLLGQPFMTGLWFADIPPIGSIGTPLIFDVGVYLVVIGVVLKIIFTLGEE